MLLGTAVYNGSIPVFQEEDEYLTIEESDALPIETELAMASVSLQRSVTDQGSQSLREIYSLCFAFFFSFVDLQIL